MIYICGDYHSIIKLYLLWKKNGRLNNAQLGILRLLANMDTEEQIQELNDVISSYYAKKATSEMDKLWLSGEWDKEKNEEILKEHL